MDTRFSHLNFALRNKKTFQQLESMGIKTLGAVKKIPEQVLLNRLGKFGNHLIKLSCGVDRSTVRPYTPHKSVSSERTLAEDTRDKKLLNNCILRQSEEVARQLRKSQVKAGTITLKIKHSDFKLVTRSKTIATPTQSSKTIYRNAAKLLDDYQLTKKIRLIGVGTSGFKSAGFPVQLDLFDQAGKNDSSWEKIDQTVENIAKKFGRDVISRASLNEP
jgi:DNA polymerase-4